jgi:cytochrome c oxidase subunit 3
MLASLWPNYLAKRSGEREDLRKVRRYLVIMSVLGLALLGLRALEIALLHTKWDHNAYGSVVWLLLGFHTVHLLTDVVDTIVLTVLMFTRHGHGRRYPNVGQNADYWYFVVAAWVPVYVIVYLFPRW